MPVKRLLGVLLLAVSWWGCGAREPEPGSPEAEAIARRGPIRLARESFRGSSRKDGARAPLVLDDAWRILPRDAARVEAEGVRLSSATAPVVLRRALQVQTDSYTVLRVQMRASAGATCTFRWKSDLEPVLGENPGIAIPILPGDSLRTYVIPLEPGGDAPWLGIVDEIELVPSDVPAEVEVRQVAFEYVPRSAAPRATILNRTHEALFGAYDGEAFTVPAGAVFEASVGLLERSWRVLGSDGVRFTVRIEGDGIESTEIVDRTLRPTVSKADRGWQTVSADLSRFRGERCRLSFRFESVGTKTGDFAVWGAPMVVSPVPDASRVPIVLISCDTLRADHVSCYGYERETTPNLDRFAEEGVVFETVTTQAGWTLPSHMTMLTGLYPKHHGVTAHVNLAESTRTLAEMLRDEGGYVTAAFTGQSWWFLPWRGLARGFDHYAIPDGFREIFETHSLAYEWLERHASTNCFLFLHNYDIHGKPPGTGRHNADAMPYFPARPRYLRFSKALPMPPRFRQGAKQEFPGALLLRSVNWSGVEVTPEEREYIIALYDDSILSVDAALGECFDKLKELGLYDGAMIAVTSDHGEEFLEHGKFLHGQAYETVSHVPLIIRFPRGRLAGRRYGGLVQLTDLAPTILAAAGVPVPADMDGQDLATLLSDDSPPRSFAYSESFTTKSVRSPRAKLLFDTSSGGFEFYDLAEDPGEQQRLAGEGLAEYGAMKQELEEFHQAAPGGWHVLFKTAGRAVNVEVEAETDSRFEYCDVERRELREFRESTVRTDSGARSMTATVALDAHDADEIRLLTAAPNGAVSFSFSSPLEFVVRAGGAHWMTAREATLLLDPMDERYRVSPGEREPAEVPSITIWYEEPAIQRSAAHELTEEDYENLRALGYLGDDEGKKPRSPGEAEGDGAR